MSLNSIVDFNSAFRKFYLEEKQNIKKWIYEKFAKYIYKKNLETPTHSNDDNLLLKAIYEYIYLSYICDLQEKNLNIQNYKVISNYIENCQKQIRKKTFENVVIVTAKSVSKEDKEVNEIVNYITKKLYSNVSIKNFGWYSYEYFLKEMKYNKSNENFEIEFKNFFYKYDGELFNQIKQEKKITANLNFKELWYNFFDEVVIMQFLDFLNTNFKIDKQNLQKNINKILESSKINTVYIFLNNVEMKSNYKNALLNDQQIFYSIIHYSCPIFFIGENKTFNFLKPLVLEEFQTLNDFIFFMNKKDKIEIDYENTNTLTRHWPDIIADDQHKETINQFFFEEKNGKLKSEMQDLEQTVALNEVESFWDLSKIENNDFANVICEVTREDNLSFYNNFKNEKIEFNWFINLFDECNKQIKLIHYKYDQNKYELFKQKINNYTISQTLEFVLSRKEKLTMSLKSKALSKQDMMYFHALYIKVKSCLNEIDFIDL